MSNFAILFVLTFLGGIAATILVDVSWGIYLYQMQYFLNPIERWWYSERPHLRYSLIVSIFILISFVFRSNRYAVNKLFDMPQTKWLMIFLIMMIATSFWAVWPEKHLLFLQNHIKLMVFIAIAYKTIDTPVKFERMIWAFLIGNFYIGWESHNLGRTGFGRLEETGPADTGGDGNCTAAILLTAVPLLLFYIFKGKYWQRGLSLIFMAYILDSIVLINSRGAFLGLSVSLAYLIACYSVTKKIVFKDRLKMILFIFIGIGLFLYLTDATFWERMATITKEAGEEKGGGGRMFYWIKTFDLVAQHPFGVGGWGYQYLSPQFIPNEMLTNDVIGLRRRAEHSTYFQCFAEYGYLGIPVFTGMVLSNFLLMRKCKRQLAAKNDLYYYYMGTAILAGLIGYLSAATFLSLLYPEMLYWFFMFIACFANIYIKKNNMTGDSNAIPSSQQISTTSPKPNL